MKRTAEKAGIDIFSSLTAKADLYDHLKNQLQVSYDRNLLNVSLVLYALLRDVHPGLWEVLTQRGQEAAEVERGPVCPGGQIRRAVSEEPLRLANPAAGDG